MKKTKNKPRRFLTLGRNVAKLRELAGYSNQEDLAHDAKVDLSGLKNIERGVSEGSFETRQKRAHFFRCDFSALYAEPQPKPKLDFSDAGTFLVKLSKLASLRPDLHSLVVALVLGDETLASREELPGEVFAFLQDYLKDT